MLNFRAPSALVERVDKWAEKQEDMPSRSEAIRRLIEKALGDTLTHQ
jgi:metal-responsive CopG/Arc/MetJ family transcriptional regulator